MDTMIAGEISVLDFLYFSAIFLLSMITFFNRQTRAGNRLYYIWWAVFLLVWVTAIVSSRPLAAKILISLLVFSAFVVQMAIARKKKAVVGRQN